MTQAELAPAKVNLCLHVGPLDADGYHPLASLVAFADVGDRVSVQPGAFGLAVTGPFAQGVPADDSNLILRALEALGDVAGIGQPDLSVTLDKRLPVASGLGGGSSDAGAALRLARQVLDLDSDDAVLAEVALCIGSDGPMCLFPATTWAEGRGELLTPEPRLPALPCVLVNPGLPSPTGAVYRAYDAGSAREADRPALPVDWERDAVIEWLAGQRNDLQGPAISLTPGIGDTLAVVQASPGVRLTRMSGSGATVFGLYSTPDAAQAAAAAMRAAHPDWWVVPTVLGGTTVTD